MVHTAVQQLRYVVRKLRRAPLFTATAVLTLALGIGANAAIFSVINGVLLKPLPFEDPETLVGVWHRAPGLGFDQVNQSPAMHLTYRDDNQVFEDVGIWDNRTVSITGLDEPEQVPAMVVNDGFFPILRITPEVGRLFTAEDDTPGSPETVMLSYGYWQRAFGGDRSVIGRSLSVNSLPREIIGVLPRGFEFARGDASIYLPVRFDRSQLYSGNFDYQGIARLAPGVTLAQANADVERLIPISVERFPGGLSLSMLEQAGFAADVHPLIEDFVGDVGGILWVLLGTVGLLLLIACANVANLFLVRAEGRQQEVAIRTAMGAGRGKIARQFLLESVVLGVVGGVVGLALAYVGTRLLVAFGPENLPRMNEIGVDPAVLLFTFGISVFAGLVFGFFPVLRLRALSLVTALKEGGRGSSTGKERHRARNALVVAQVALALVLLVGSGLMFRTFQALRQVDPGFERPEEVMSFRVSIPDGEVSDPEQVALQIEAIQRNLEEIPGVASVGASFSLPLDGYDSNDALWIEDFPTPEGQIPPIRRFKWVGGDLFETLERRLVAGRTISWADVHDRRPVVVITENMAREYWDNPTQAVGRRVGTGDPANISWIEIVGVVADVPDNGVGQDLVPTAYFPYAMNDFRGEGLFVMRTMAYAIRSAGPPPGTLLPEIREAVWSVNPNLPLANVRTLKDIFDRSMARTSFTMVLLGIAAAVALLLGSVGIYGVISYLVSQRTREIGVRMALGAERSDVRRLVLRQGLGIALIGVGVGLASAFGLTRLMSSLLYGVEAADPLTFGVVAAALAGVAMLATYLPARRASGVDPVTALRWE